MGTIEFKKKSGLLHTPLSNQFIEHAMPLALPAYSIIYIYILKACYCNEELTTENIANALALLETDVLRAFDYWKEMGYLSYEKIDDRLWVTLQEPPYVYAEKESQKEPLEESKKTNIASIRPFYDEKELQIYMEKEEEIKNLFDASQTILGKLLSYQDMSILFGFYDWLRMPVDLILFCLTSCVNLHHTNMRYIEKVAIDWTERGIDSVEKAKLHIERFQVKYRKIFQYMGITERNPIDSEAKMMDKWLDEWKMNKELIQLACEKAVMNTGKANFPYADQILSKWKNQGIKTINEVKTNEEIFYQDNQKTKTLKKKNKFMNHEQRNWNFEELEAMEKNYLKNL